MCAPEKRALRLSAKGQVALPKSIRRRHNWEAGAALMIEDPPEGVVLKQASLFPPTRLNDVFGVLKYSGPPETIEEMDASVLAEARRRARD
ncbi:MAG: AbrB/MazE/SpoVT family DNA-binding domain-containing protein [Methylocystis sp.]|nr:AbrB/MazE/SpoVT family DNA-binding domain-containing protein [Methylocystis sp.]